MKLMTYNIFNGAPDRLDLIEKTVKEENPNYLSINEANTFSNYDNKILKEFAQKTNFPYFEIALSGDGDYHVAAFSKSPFKQIHQITPLMRACIVGLVETEIGPLSIAGFHLTPYTEEARVGEVKSILRYQMQFENRILMGDMNSLSKRDNYDEAIVKHFNKTQLDKYTKQGKLQFAVTKSIENAGYVDSSVQLKKNNQTTVPTQIGLDQSHGNMRLDYIFVSENLAPKVKEYNVIKNEITKKASDHFPITVTL